MQCVNRERIGFPVRPPHFSRVRTKINLPLFYQIFRSFASAKQCQFPVKTLPIFIRLFGAGKARAHLPPVVCQSSLTYSSLTYSDLSPLGAENNDTQILCLLCAVLRYFLNAQVLYHVSRLMSKLEIFHLCLYLKQSAWK